MGSGGGIQWAVRNGVTGQKAHEFGKCKQNGGCDQGDMKTDQKSQLKDTGCP